MYKNHWIPPFIAPSFQCLVVCAKLVHKVQVPNTTLYQEIFSTNLSFGNHQPTPMQWQTSPVKWQVISCGITTSQSSLGPLLVDLGPPTKTLLLPNSRSRTKNKCELTHQFTFWNGDIHCLSFRAMQKEVTSFLNLGQLRFSTKRSPRGKSVVFRKPLFLCLETVIPLFRWKKTFVLILCCLCFVFNFF